MPYESIFYASTLHSPTFLCSKCFKGTIMAKMTKTEFKLQCKQNKSHIFARHGPYVSPCNISAWPSLTNSLTFSLSNHCTSGWAGRLSWSPGIAIQKTLPISKSSSSVSISACGTAGGGWHFLSWNAKWFIKINNNNYIGHISKVLQNYPSQVIIIHKNIEIPILVNYHTQFYRII